MLAANVLDTHVHTDFTCVVAQGVHCKSEAVVEPHYTPLALLLVLLLLVVKLNFALQLCYEAVLHENQQQNVHHQ